MITRYSLTATADVLQSKYKAEVPERYKPIYNAAPTQLLPVITHDSQKGFSFFYWGAPPEWARNKALGEKIINVRTETLEEKTVLRKKLIAHRCIVPADGFYEWKRIGRRTNIPYRFTLADKGLFAIAGMWEEYEDEAGETNHTFTILTVPASTADISIAARIPFVLSADSVHDWLNATGEDVVMKILDNPVTGFEHYSVSSLINSPDRNDKLAIIPSPPADQYGNLTLFD
ncbi:MAG: SOS response-associated peptidase [Bacteroidetes bacterium]|nr:SOS response-associated peptidase [Bacteroidota bacterium]